MRSKSQAGYRHEIKFLMSKAEAELLKRRLDVVLTRDAHAKDGIYQIRSLYFDDRDFSAYEDKLAGTESRKKYRIRFYNGCDKVIHLECKRKEEQYIKKTSACLTGEEALSLASGRYDFLRQRSEDICRSFYMECMLNGMKPSVIVDYMREAYVYPYGDVRITFDSSIRAGMYKNEIFDMSMPAVEVIGRDQLILEVKYTEYLPEIIRDLLSTPNSIQLAFSKYTMCLEKRKEF